jgi:lipopolysaccharide export system permease protein
VKIINRYILSETTQYFAVSLFAFIGMLLTIRMIKLANLVVNRGVSITEISTIFIAVIPTFLEIALPLAALLGVMLAFARLSGDSEIIVLRGSGISIKGMVTPIVIFGVLVTVIGQLTSVYLRPWGFRTLQDGLYQIAKSKSTAGLEQAVFNKLGSITLYAQTIEHSSGDLNHVVVDDKRQGQSRRVIVAQRGYVTSQDQQRALSLLLIDGTIHEQIDNKYVLTRFDENTITLDPQALYGEEGEKRGRKVAELSNQEIAEISKNLSALPIPESTDAQALLSWRMQVQEILGNDDAKTFLPKDIPLRLARNQIEQGRRFSLPCASLFLGLLGMALGIQPARAQRAWGASLSIALGMGVFIVYYVLFSISVTLAETQKISPMIALWGPNILVGLLSIYMIKNISSERWPSVSAALEALITPVLERLKRFRAPREAL